MLQSAPMVKAGIGGLGPWELGIVLVIVLVVFGAGKLPEIGSALGSAIQNFKKGTRGEKDAPEKSVSKNVKTHGDTDEHTS